MFELTGRIDTVNASQWEEKIMAEKPRELDAEKLDCGFIAFCYIKMKQHSHENAVQLMTAVQEIPEIVECYNISGDYDFLLKIYVKNMKQYQEFVLRILGDIPAIGNLNSSFVLGEVKNSHYLPI